MNSGPSWSWDNTFMWGIMRFSGGGGIRLLRLSGSILTWDQDSQSISMRCATVLNSGSPFFEEGLCHGGFSL